MHINTNNKEELGSCYEENMIFSQEFNGHPRDKKTHIHTGATEDHDFVLIGKKLTLVRVGCRGSMKQIWGSLM